MEKENVLFICTGNSVRSQMAEAFLRHLGKDYFNSYSAGSNPCYVHPMTIKVMEEVSISMQEHRSKHFDEYIGKAFDYVITLCEVAAISCPEFPGTKEKINWFTEDPIRIIGDNERKLMAFQITRNIIRQKVTEFIKEKTS